TPSPGGSIVGVPKWAGKFWGLVSGRPKSAASVSVAQVATRTIDINCDLGESFGNWQLGDDAAILGEITTANVACGFHAGDPVTQLRTVAMARERGVAVGAHPGLPDLLGFGRRKMAVTAEEAAAYVTYQVGTVREALRRHGGGELHHV